MSHLLEIHRSAVLCLNAAGGPVIPSTRIALTTAPNDQD